jgi:uncharacterized membrane protein
MYLILKVIHVGAVVVFLGNITTGIFWKTIADASNNIEIMKHSVRGITRSDRVFTVPALVVLIAAGIATAVVGNVPILHTGWILWSLILLSVSGFAFIPVSRLQVQLFKVLDRQPPDMSLYRKLSDRRRYGVQLPCLRLPPLSC